MYKQGKIILVPFPFTDLSGDKVRPALILNHKIVGDDVTACFISSKAENKAGLCEMIIKTTDTSFSKTGLKLNSIIKVNKIATLDKKVVLGELGELGSRHMTEVKLTLKVYLGLR